MERNKIKKAKTVRMLDCFCNGRSRREIINMGITIAELSKGKVVERCGRGGKEKRNSFFMAFNGILRTSAGAPTKGQFWFGPKGLLPN